MITLRRLIIHVYADSAEQLSVRVRRADPTSDVIALVSRDALAAALPEIEVLFAPMPPRDGWARAERLRLIQLLGAGVDQLLPSPDLPAHVAVAGVRGVFAPEVAEHAIAMMLAHAKRLRAIYDDQRAHRFDESPRERLAGERLAIIGHGEVGRRIERIARALEMDVRAIARRDRVADLGAALADARYIAIALPLTPATDRLFDAALLARLRTDAYLVNVARGEIVDEAALVAALRAGRLAGAALDVFVHEPLVADSPRWDAPNVTITPHVAGLGEHYIDRCIAVLLDNARALESGGALRCVVDRDAGY